MERERIKAGVVFFSLVTYVVIALTAVFIYNTFENRLTPENYVESLRDDTYLVIENTATDEDTDFFVHYEDDTQDLIEVKEVNSKWFPKEEDYTHKVTEVEESDKGMNLMLDVSVADGSTNIFKDYESLFNTIVILYLFNRFVSWILRK